MWQTVQILKYIRMKTMRQYASILLIGVLLISLVGCSDDEEELEYELYGRTWVGDIGMTSHDGFPLYSEFHFNPDGFGEEYQYYRGGDFYDRFTFRWYRENPYNNLVLDYGNFGISYMDDVHVGRNIMTGIFYIDEYAPGFPFTLEMW